MHEPAPHETVGVLPANALPFSWVGLSARMAERDGLPIRQTLVDFGVESQINEDTPIGPAAFMLMCILIINGIDDEMHGLSRKRMARGTAAGASVAMASQRTLFDGLQKMLHFFERLNAPCALRLTRGRNGAARIELSSASPDEPAGPIVEEMLAHYLHHQLSFFAGFRLPLTLFESRSHHHPAIYARHPYLLCPVVPGNATAVSFPAHYLDLQCGAPGSDAPLWEAQRIWLQDHPALADDEPSTILDAPLARDVYTVLLESNATEILCCAHFKMSLSEFKRSLAATGTNFRALRRKALITRIRPHVESGSMIEDIAATLGYSDARSLRRAVKLAGGGGIREMRRGSLLNQSALMAQLRTQTLLMS